MTDANAVAEDFCFYEHLHIFLMQIFSPICINCWMSPFSNTFDCCLCLVHASSQCLVGTYEAAVPWSLRNPYVWLNSQVPTAAPAPRGVRICGLAAALLCSVWFWKLSQFSHCTTDGGDLHCYWWYYHDCWGQFRFGLGSSEARLGLCVSGCSRLHGWILGRHSITSDPWVNGRRLQANGTVAGRGLHTPIWAICPFMLKIKKRE